MNDFKYYILEYRYKLYGGESEGMIMREVHTNEESLKRSLCDVETNMKCSDPVVITVETYTVWTPNLGLSFNEDK